MKITVTYDLSKEEDRYSYEKTKDATNMHLALYDLAVLFRGADKYNSFAGSTLTNDVEKCLMHEVYKQFWIILNEYELDPFTEPTT